MTEETSPNSMKEGKAYNGWVKRANIHHHNCEARVFERAHPEGSDIYEQKKVAKNLNLIVRDSNSRDLCVDVGCGTGFLTSYELLSYHVVVAADISRRMVEVSREKLGHSASLNLLICDAEFLPLRSEIADLISVASVLHHLPKPLNSLTETYRVLRQSGFLFLSREPNSKSLRRFFKFIDEAIVRKLARLLGRLSHKSGSYKSNNGVNGLDYANVDVHFAKGFYLSHLTKFLSSKSFEVLSAYSYHWIFPESDKGALQVIIAKSNFGIEKIPLAKKLGRYLLIVCRKSKKKAT